MIASLLLAFINTAILPAFFAGCVAPYVLLNEDDEDKFIPEAARRKACLAEHP